MAITKRGSPIHRTLTSHIPIDSPIHTRKKVYNRKMRKSFFVVVILILIVIFHNSRKPTSSLIRVPTDAPTNTPTNTPINTPTFSRTSEPTMEPTSAPTTFELHDCDEAVCQAKAPNGIIIIGAGAAGLSAAASLKLCCGDEYFRSKIRVLEASHVYGGRIRKSDAFVDYPIDLGPSYLNDESTLDKIAGKIANTQTLTNTDQSQDLPKVANVADVCNDSVEYKGFTNHTPRATSVCHKRYDDDYLFQGNGTWYDFFDKHVVAPAKLEDGIVYDCVVDSVKMRIDSSLEVSCSNNSTYTADYAIVAVPLSVLKDGDIRFDPPLPQNVEKAISKRHMQQGFKVFFEFSQKFYNDYFTCYDPADYTEECVFWDDSMVKQPNLTTRHVLAGYHMGVYQDGFENDYESMTDDEIAKRMLQNLDTMFASQTNQTNVATTHYLNHTLVNWSREPFVRGTYADKPVRIDVSERIILNGRAVLAGEAFPMPVDFDHGWVYSASMSGKHAAQQVVQLMAAAVTTMDNHTMHESTAAATN